MPGRSSSADGASPPPAGRRSIRQARQPRLAEIVAAELRNEILQGALTEGDELPRQEVLMEEFNVSSPAVREAMRILETEGLVTVRRGNLGGAVVHLPTAERVAYMAGMVLQSKGTTLRDVAVALREIEPVCASLCAGREDREVAVVPALQAIVDEQAPLINRDLPGYAAASRRFHTTLVNACGNQTMILMIGALETIWSKHDADWYTRTQAAPALAAWRAAHREHVRIVQAITRGDGAAAARISRQHLDASQAYTLSAAGDRPVTASVFG